MTGDEREELNRLLAENRRLRELLAEHGIAWQPPDPTTTTERQARLGTDEKVKLFASLFRGREDVYPIRWESTSGKSGYSPADRVEQSPAPQPAADPARMRDIRCRPGAERADRIRKSCENERLRSRPVNVEPSRGSLLIVVAPSGAGKTSLVRHLLSVRDGLRLSVSFTTRAPRPGERDGIDYRFVSTDEFLARRDRAEFLEWAQVHGNHYGTSRAWIADQMASGVDIVLEIDWQGAAQVRRIFPDAVSVFIAPPSLDVLRQRLTARGQDAPDVIERRMAAARSELEHAAECQYVIINQDFAAACQALVGIADAARCRFPQQRSRHPALFVELGMDGREAR